MVIYSGNKKKTGGLLETSYNIEKGKNKRSDISFFFKIKKQTGYDAKNHQATFKDGKTKNVKFSRTEIGNIITVFQSAISGGKITKWSGYHKAEQESTKINFSHYYKKSESDSDPDINMFTLQYIVGNEKYQVGISVGDMYALMTEINNALATFSDIEIDEANKERIEFSRNSNNESNSDDGSNDDSDDQPEDNTSEEDDDVPF